MNEEDDQSVNLNPRDKSTKVAHLGFRCAYTVIAWLILGLNIPVGHSFFVSLFLFSVPLFMDYLRFIPDTRTRLIIRHAGIISTGAWAILGLIGAFSVLSIIEIENSLSAMVSKEYIVLQGLKFPVYFIWYLMFLNVFLTIIDAINYESSFESELRQDIRESMASGQNYKKEMEG